MTKNLLDFAKESVEEIGSKFTKPDQDWRPTLLVKAYDDEVHIMQMGVNMDDEDAKDVLGDHMFAITACLRATEVAFVSGAYMLQAKSEEEFRAGPLPKEHAESVEVVNIMYSSHEGDIISSAEVTRSFGFDPPTLGEWDEHGGPGMEIGGRFGRALHAGIEVGKQLAGPITPPEITQYMNEEIEAGRLQQLCESFLRGRDRAFADRENGK